MDRLSIIVYNVFENKNSELKGVFLMGKKIFKNRIFIFVLGVFIASSISVLAATYFESSAVTYDNTESGLSSTNVQGAIDELYNECLNMKKAGSYLKEEIQIII